MDIPLSERRQIENEMIFRRKNEKLGDQLDKLDAQNAKENNQNLMWDDDTLLKFRCECSDENCEMRIAIKLSVYKKIHADRKSYIIKHEHQVDEIEEVIRREKEYSVVRKNKTIADPGKTLNKTSIDNS